MLPRRSLIHRVELFRFERVSCEGDEGVFFSQQQQQQEDKMAAYSEGLEAAEGEHYSPNMSLRSHYNHWL